MEFENNSDDDLEIAVFIAALAADDATMKYATQFLTVDDVALITDMIARSKDTVDTKGFMDWITTRVVAIVEREKARLLTQVIH